MSKPRKKRTKKYTGADAATNRPTVTRVQAVSRSPLKQWLHEREKILKTTGKVVLVLLVVAIIISGIISLF